MFTGIVTDVGRVRFRDQGSVLRLGIETHLDPATIEIGASICHSGVCLTVVQLDERGWEVEAAPETLSRTTAGDWQVGSRINLERSLALGDELGGHLVYGHVDGLARLESREAAPGNAGSGWTEAERLVFSCDRALGRFVAEKGSVALDGVSLTVTHVDDGDDGRTRFGISVIPHTLAVTTLGELAPGDKVNFEVDMLARYVARLVSAGQA